MSTLWHKQWANNCRQLASNYQKLFFSSSVFGHSKLLSIAGILLEIAVHNKTMMLTCFKNSREMVTNKADIERLISGYYKGYKLYY